MKTKEDLQNESLKIMNEIKALEEKLFDIFYELEHLEPHNNHERLLDPLEFEDIY